MGRHALSRLLDKDPARVIKVFLLEGHPLKQRCLEKKVAMQVVTRGKLEQLVESTSHQGCAAQIEPEETFGLQDIPSLIPEGQPALIIAVDGVCDPNNFGAILRSAEALGASAILYSPHRCVGMTASVRKVATGATELLPLIEVSNLADSLERIKKQGFSVVVSAMEEGCSPLSSFLFSPRTVLVLGSEGDGIRPLTLKKADAIVKIAMLGQIESLNVSSAAAIFFYAWHCQHGVKK